jgi:hypothetical protein
MPNVGMYIWHACRQHMADEKVIGSWVSPATEFRDKEIIG